MAWYHFIAYFFAGALLSNAVPHYVMAACGRKFPTPFAKPPGKGESSPMVNSIWGLANFTVGFLLLQVGQFSIGLNLGTLTMALGVVLMSIMLAKHFGGLYAS
ncbi:MAG: hypothetical protein GXP16_12280 [Gammaproteobacteria bacterium]|nr:hypothetical protein [Gammaproteobacteria bacterium]